MAAFRIIYALTTMFSLTYCYDYAFTFDMPSIVNSFTNMLATQSLGSTQALTSTRTSPDFDADADSEAEGPTLAETLQTATRNVVGYMATMLSSLTRRVADKKADVEMGPGSFKTEQVTYPPNFYVNRLKMLLKFKKKEEEKNKLLNKP